MGDVLEAARAALNSYPLFFEDAATFEHRTPHPVEAIGGRTVYNAGGNGRGRAGMMWLPVSKQ